MSARNWLITGGCGFIGTSLIQSLVEQGQASGLRVVDNLSVGTTAALEDVAKVRRRTPEAACWDDLEPGEVELLRADILDQDAALRAGEGADVIVHLAANTGVQPSIEDPGLDAEVNIRGTLNFLESARHNGVGGFVFASSGAPTGNVTPPIHEDLPCRPLSPYGASKLAGEAYCSAYFWSFQVNTIALRFSNVYGPRSGLKNSVVAKLIRQALDGQPWTINGDGSQTRDFISVHDLVDAICKAGRSGKGGELYQIATARETSVSELAGLLGDCLEQEAGLRPTISYGPPAMADMPRNYADNSKAKRELGWQPDWALEDGLRETVRWFLERRENKD